MKYTITKRQYDIIYSLLYQSTAPQYNIVSYNCATFALEALAKAGIKTNFKKHFWNIGSITKAAISVGFSNASLLMGMAGMPFSAVCLYLASFSFSYGYTPSQIAYDISRGVR